MLTNVALEHTDVLGDTREAIAAEKLAVIRPGARVVLGEPEWEQLATRPAPARSRSSRVGSDASRGGGREAFLGRAVDPTAADGVALPGRLERPARLRSATARTTPTGVRWLVRRICRRTTTR